MRQSSPAAYFQGGVQQSSYSAPNFNMAGAVMGPLMPGMPSMIPGPPHAAYGPMAGQPGFAMPEPAAHFRPMPPELMAQRGQTAPFRSTGDPVFMPVRPHPGSAGRNEKAGIRSQPVSNRTTPQGTPHSSQPGTPTKRTLSSQRLDPMRPMPPISPSHSATSASGRLQGHELDENDNIKVVVRVRPLNDREIANRDLSAVQVSEDDPHKMQVVVPGPKGATMARNFTFHGILSPSSKQSDVLKMCGITQLLDAALAGFHVTIFAYGQTGSGKTFTMSGREEMIENDDYSGDTDDGIVTRAVLYLFEQIQKRNNGCKYSLKASYCEIYNEALYDLLRFNKQQLAVRWDPNKGFYVPDLYVKECHSVADMLQVISRGMRHRKMGSHELNLESSRSHSIMTVHCDASPSNPEDHDYGIPKFGKISFVDLAGSERVKDSKSTGDMLKETSSINRSLFTLGKVISALADTQAGVANTAHIPYRDSKLTKLLMDSLGGSALALMIACCSPSVAHVDETLSTLSYATRAKNIRNKPIVQVNEQEATIAALRREVHLLRAENHYLRDQCQGNQLAAGQQQSLSIQPDSSRTWSRGSSFNSTTDAAGNTRVRRPTFSELTQGQHPLPLAQSLDGVGGGSMSNGLVKASSAGNLQALEGPADAAKDHSAATTSGGAASHPQQPLSSEELAQRLAEAQRMVARFSRENERLAVQNDQLRNKRTLVDNDYKGALDEVDWLRLRLENLENTLLAGASSGSPSKLGTEGRSEASSGTHTPTHGEQLAKANSSSVLNSSIGARLRDLSASQDGSPDVSPSTSPSKLGAQLQSPQGSPTTSPTTSFTSSTLPGGPTAGDTGAGNIPAPMLPGSRLRANSREGSRITGDAAAAMNVKMQPPMPVSPMMAGSTAVQHPSMPKPVPGMVAGSPMGAMQPGMRPMQQTPVPGMAPQGVGAQPQQQIRRPSGDVPNPAMLSGMASPQQMSQQPQPMRRPSGDQGMPFMQQQPPAARRPSGDQSVHSMAPHMMQMPGGMQHAPMGAPHMMHVPGGLQQHYMGMPQMVQMQAGMPHNQTGMPQPPAHPQTPQQTAPLMHPGVPPSRPSSINHPGSVPQQQAQRPASGTGEVSLAPGSPNDPPVPYQRTWREGSVLQPPPPAGQIHVDDNKLNLLLGPT